MYSHLKSGKVKKEINFLFKLIQNYFRKKLRVKSRYSNKDIGRIEKLPNNIRSTLKKTVKLTKKIKK